MYAEDEPMLARIVHRILKGHDIDHQVNGALAFDAFLQNPTSYDLVLTDNDMPGGNYEQSGVCLLERLASITGQELPPRVMASGRADKGLYQRVTSLGGAGLLAKPFDRNQLLTTVEELLASRSDFLDNYARQQKWI